jgi:hypothetical protein
MGVEHFLLSKYAAYSREVRPPVGLAGREGCVLEADVGNYQGCLQREGGVPEKTRIAPLQLLPDCIQERNRFIDVFSITDVSDEAPDVSRNI